MNQNQEPRRDAAGEQPEEPKAEPAAQSDKRASSAAAEDAEKAGAQAGTDGAAQAENQEESGEDETEAADQKPKKAPFFRSEKFRHGSTATAFTAIFIAAVVLLNVVVGMLGDRYPSMSLDLTKAGSNSLSEEAAQIVDKVKTPVAIDICATKQQAESGSLLQGADYSEVNSIAAKIAERNRNITLAYHDLDKEPDFASKYKSEGVQTGSVVVSSDKRHRVLSADGDLFQTQYSSDYSSSTMYSTVDSAFASALNAVISDALPVAAFDTGHSEQLDSSGVKKVLQNNSFEAQDFSLRTDKIPDKTQLLVLGCPTADFTADEIEKLEDFLKDEKLAGDRALMVTLSPGETALPKLASFLEEWGIRAEPAAAVVETDTQKYFSNNPMYLLADVQTKVDLGGSKSGYENFFAPSVCPLTAAFESGNDRSVSSLLKSSDASYVYKDGDSAKNPATAAQDLGLLSQQTVQGGGKARRANVVVFGSTMMFSSQIMEEAQTFSNGDYFVDLARYATGTSNTAAHVATKTTQLNPQDMTLTAQAAQILGIGVFTVLIPLAVAVAGAVIHRKRRLL